MEQLPTRGISLFNVLSEEVFIPSTLKLLKMGSSIFLSIELGCFKGQC